MENGGKHTPRSEAWKALLRVEENKGYSNLVLDNFLREESFSSRDAALASAIFYGVLEKRLTLDYYLGKCFSNPRKKPEAEVLEALRCGAFQILYLDRVPDSAAVNETVGMLKGTKWSYASGFVNGVLRNLSRKKEELLPPKGDWSLEYSIPDPLISLWKKGYGSEIVKKLLPSFQGQAPIYLRVNTQKTTPEKLAQILEDEGSDVSFTEELPMAGILKGRGAPVQGKSFREGLFHIQDLSAQWVCELLDPKPGENVCDCCAAPGGKAFTLAEKMEGKGTVYALDISPQRVKLIQEGAGRLGLTNIKAQVNDASKPFLKFPPMDRVLCDVPCSGFGVIRRKPEIRYKDLSELQTLPELQFAILEHASRLLKPGGLLLYSTCTLDPKENGEVADRFLREVPGFEPVPVAIPTVNRQVLEPEHMLTMMPFAGASDGFFTAAFRKQ